MVVTVEPGIYIAADAKGVAAKWRGIGIRIEDDVVVTRGDPEVITAAAPTDPDEIEALMAASRPKAGSMLKVARARSKD
jgi:Xaa-Pro aminopeptidase